MPLIDYPTVDGLDGGTRQLLEQMRDGQGTIPAFPHLLATNPDLLRASLEQFGEVVYGGDVDLDLKQLAFVVVSRHNDCAYCAATHGAELVEELGQPASVLETIAEGDLDALDDRQRAVAELARQAAADPKRITADHLQALRAVGFDDGEILELVTVAAQAAFANTIVDAMDVLPDDQSADLRHYYPKP